VPSLTLVNMQDPGGFPILVRTARFIAAEPLIEDEKGDENDDDLWRY
jgi:hypothetical protein